MSRGTSPPGGSAGIPVGISPRSGAGIPDGEEEEAGSEGNRFGDARTALSSAGSSGGDRSTAARISPIARTYSGDESALPAASRTEPKRLDERWHRSHCFASSG